MSQKHEVLRLSRGLLRVLIAANVVVAVGSALLFIASLLSRVQLMKALGVHALPGNSRVVLGMRLMMLVGVIGPYVSLVMLTRLLAIVDTVKSGNPFTSQNAERLNVIAWSLVGMEVMHLLVGALITYTPLDIHWHFSLTAWLPIVLTFVLARVFEEGAHMREDLEGTV